MSYFDFKKIARQANIPADKLDILSKSVRLDFPKDDMMFELHRMRESRMSGLMWRGLETR